MSFSNQANNLPPEEIIEALARESLCERYNILQKLQEEGFETVYLAESKNSFVPTKYLIQQFTPQYLSQAQSAAARDLFNQEAAILKNLGKHPQIPSIHDYFENRGQFFVVQEFISGQNFQAELSKAQPYSETEIIEFLYEILPVLQFIHENNYIHRDIKPSHLMRNSVNQKIYLINFYSIKEKINPQNLDITGKFMPYLIVGTQGYIPMEQHLGKPEFCSDLYALGIVIIQALTKIKLTQLDYDDDNNPVWRHLLPNISNFSPQFLDIIDTMVRCNYQQRYQTAIAVITSLKQLNSSSQFTETNLILKNSESVPHYNERILIQQEPEATENTFIIGNPEASSPTIENTFILQNNDNDMESTRIIDSKITRDQNSNNTINYSNKHKLQFLAIIVGLLMTITFIIALFIVKNNKNSVPQNSSFFHYELAETLIPQY
ncbi:MAG: serine/threonine-protein kinase [Xenococcus sp. MO_188.B8]|nr:serine/threonine-protein kinase [Xenococcus sp. MO_188.B8]